jgi:hypothetical protein
VTRTDERQAWYDKHDGWEGGLCCREAGDKIIEPLLDERDRYRRALERIASGSLSDRRSPVGELQEIAIAALTGQEETA